MPNATYPADRTTALPDDVDQQRFWNEWNAKFRGPQYDPSADPPTMKRRETALEWIRQLRLHGPRILDRVGELETEPAAEQAREVLDRPELRNDVILPPIRGLESKTRGHVLRT